jgi:hypothetical protein
MTLLFAALAPIAGGILAGHLLHALARAPAGPDDPPGARPAAPGAPDGFQSP